MGAKMAKCPYDPKEMKGAPIGMFHCPVCGEMVLAGVEHPDYSILDDKDKDEDEDNPAPNYVLDHEWEED
jgi:hypothetical protein